MKNFALTILLFSCIFSHFELLAQDIHFSQFYASPLTLNPAMTGFSQGDYRLTGIYRNQWASVTTPFVTYSVSYDMKVLQDKLKEDLFGVGLVMFNDQSGDGSLTTMNVMGSASYHKALGSRNYLALGVQGGYVQKSIDFDRLDFPNEFQDGAFTGSHGENFKKNKLGQIDIQAGLLWHGRLTEKTGLFAGVSMFHITRPKESFINNQENRLASRYVFNGGMRMELSEKIQLTPNFIFMSQNKAREFNIGTAVEYHLKTSEDEKAIFSLGGWYRIGDAAIASLGIDYRNVRLGFAYDFNISDLQEVSNGRGGFEISLIYLGFLPKSTPDPIYVPCPRL